CCSRASLRTPPAPTLELGATGVPARVGWEKVSLVPGIANVNEGSARNVGWARHAQPLSGGGGGKECAARHERSNDWPQGGAAPITRSTNMREPRKPLTCAGRTDRSRASLYWFQVVPSEVVC